MSWPRPTASDVVVHSPTPSMVRMAASSKGDGKKALAAWLKWCSPNSSLRSRSLAPGSMRRSSFRTRSFWNSFSRSHSGMAMRNDRNPRGAKARYVSSRRSNFKNGLS